jgi:hypothetical protein
MTDRDAAQTFLSGAYVESFGKVTRFDFVAGIVVIPGLGFALETQRPPNDVNSLPHTVFSSTTTSFTQSFVPNPNEVYHMQSGSTGALRATVTTESARVDGVDRMAFLLFGDLKAIYVPFSEVLRIWSPGPMTGTPALTIAGPKLAFFSGNSQNFDVPAGGLGSMIVTMQAIGMCGVPASRRSWTPQKACLCMDALTVSFGRAFWQRWHGGTGECDAVMRESCTGKMDSAECACIKEEKEFGDGVECLGPSCSRDFANVAYRPGNVNACSQTVCKQFLGDGTFVADLSCGGVKYNITPEGEVVVDPNDPANAAKIDPLTDVTSVSLEVWLVVGAGVLMFILFAVMMSLWFRR